MSQPANTSTARNATASTTRTTAVDTQPPQGSSVAPAGATPFFETSPHPNPTRRMLLVFFDFAPSAEVGALRWISMTRFGAERGWCFDVVTMAPDYMGTLDESRLAQLPPGVRLFGFDGRPPTWYRVLITLWLKARVLKRGRQSTVPTPGMVGHLDGVNLDNSLSTPDDASVLRRSFRSRVHFALADLFAQRGAEMGIALARQNHYDLVLSSGPPHAAHDAGRMIASATGRPFVMDMRDPWSDASATPEEMSSPLWERLARSHEDRCVAAADMVVVTSRAHASLQEKKYPALRGRVRTVMNGADRDPLPASDPGKRFVVAFAGMIYLGRNPRPLFRAAARVVRETGATLEQFGVAFLGDEACNGVPLTTIAAEEGLGPYFTSYPFRPRREAMSFLARASVLVSLPLRTVMTLPAKLFEYARFDAWLLALAEPGSATADLLDGTGADIVAPNDVDGIARVLHARFDDFRTGVRPISINRDGRFDRSTQAAHLYDALDGVVSSLGQRAVAEHRV